MASSKPNRRIPLLSAFAWSFSVSGLLTLLGNLVGLAGHTWVFPAVDHLPGLLITSMLLFLVGLVPYVLHGIRRTDAS